MRFNPKTSTLTIPLLYAAAGTLWILASDTLLALWLPSFRAGALKGLLFVIVTATLLHGLIGRRDRLLREAETRASSAERMRIIGELTARITHDLNNLLMASRTLLPRLRRHLDGSPEGARLIQQLTVTDHRAAYLTAEVLSFSSPHGLAYDNIALGTWLAACEAEFNAALGPNVRITATVQPPSLTVDADEIQLHRLITNLVFNAAEAMSHRGNVTLTAVAAPDSPSMVRISVSDNGPGIAADVAAHIFEPLVTTKRCGTGLGLPIVKRIADQHGGVVLFDSHSGVGTTFHLFLPKKQLASSIAGIAASTATETG